MNRIVAATLAVTVTSAARLAVQVAAANPAARGADETVDITLDGQVAVWSQVDAPHGGRLWVIDAPPGQLRINYEAKLANPGPIPTTDIADRLVYLRPSRYCESDRLIGFASRLFRNITGADHILAAVSSWVGTQLEYLPGSSSPVDGAIDTLLSARGVCRDYAHLAIALLRAMEIPARLVAVYAPGLQPMDFHAVVEAYVDGGWSVIDSTLLAPRESLVRISTGRDAADTAFLSSYGGAVTLDAVSVTAIVDGDELPIEDVTKLVQLR